MGSEPDKDYITSWSLFLKSYTTNLLNPLSIIGSCISLLSFVVDTIPMKVKFLIVLLGLFIIMSIAFYKTLNDLFISVAELKNNRETILDSLKRYQSEHKPYREVIYQIYERINIVITDSTRNKQVLSLRDEINGLLKNFNLIDKEKNNG